MLEETVKLSRLLWKLLISAKRESMKVSVKPLHYFIPPILKRKIVNTQVLI